MPLPYGKEIIIVGGGASGTLLAVQLLRDPSAHVRVTLVEKGQQPGLGLAYSTSNPSHLLNVRAVNMSAFPDDPDHFVRWLATDRAADDLGCADRFCFAPRKIYGRYIASLLEPFLPCEGRPSRLRIVRRECTAITETAAGVEALFDDGTRLAGEIAVLATGNEATRAAGQAGAIQDPWDASAREQIPKDGRVLILGTGLTMVDTVLSLLQSGHTGSIVALSRRGLLPHVHREVVARPITADEVPFGVNVAHLLHWLRMRAEQTQTRGGDWRSVVDGLRPFIAEIWRTLPAPERRRFMRHARPWWDVHRHRMAPQVAMRIANTLAEGQLNIIAGKVMSVVAENQDATVHYRRRGGKQIETMPVAAIVDCTGISSSPRHSPNPLVRDLLSRGITRPDPLDLGLDVTESCALINQTGHASQRLFAVGPITRGRFWEIMAVPDIRIQCANLAAAIIGSDQLTGKEPCLKMAV
ncbi:MAG: FAD/NAD(P)-binding protein [Xanthobacteraceae bacterium]|nr:FAD/NAD(P)-binding protein [Xanthobacteraceae bacterium]